MSWLNTLASGEGAAAFSGFLKNLEEKIDKALDIPEDTADVPDVKAATSNVSVSLAREAEGEKDQVPTLMAFKELSTTLSAGFQAAASGLANASKDLAKSSSSSGKPPDDFMTSMFGSIMSTETSPAKKQLTTPSVAQSPPKTKQDRVSLKDQLKSPPHNKPERARSASPKKSLAVKVQEPPMRASMDAPRPSPVADTQNGWDLDDALILDDKSLDDSTSLNDPTATETDLKAIKEPELKLNDASPEKQAAKGSLSEDDSPPEKEDSGDNPSSTNASSSKEKEETMKSQKSTEEFESLIEQRESQLVKTMQQNAQLNDTVAELTRNNESLAAKVEKLSRKLEELQRDGSSATEVNFAKLSRDLAEKNEKIKELLKEGEMLSTKELKNNISIKKLKAKDAENEKTVKELNKKLDQTTQENVEFKEQVSKMKDLERRHTETIKNLSSLNEEHSRQFKKMESEFKETKSKLEELQDAYDSSKKKLEEVTKEKEAVASAALSDQLEAEKKAREALIQEYEEFKNTSNATNSSLRKELFDVRSALQRLEEESGWKEDNYRKEVAMLQNRLQAAEARQEELAFLGNEANKPLLRQIEALQNQYNSSLKDWENLEKSLVTRIKEAEASKNSFADQDRFLRAELDEYKLKLQSMEAQVERQKHERSSANHEVTKLQAKIQVLEEKIATHTSELDTLSAKHAQEMEKLKTITEIKTQKTLEKERRLWDEEKQRDLAKIRAETLQVKRQDSQLSDESRKRRDSSVFVNFDMEPSQLESVQKQSSVAIERLQISIRQLEEQIKSLQVQLDMTTKTRDDLAQEVFKLSNENEEWKRKVEQVEQLESKKTEIESKFMACVELLGEKEEKINELQADIGEMKIVYQTQVQELCAKINALSKKP